MKADETEICLNVMRSCWGKSLLTKKADIFGLSESQRRKCLPERAESTGQVIRGTGQCLNGSVRAADQFLAGSVRASDELLGCILHDADELLSGAVRAADELFSGDLHAADYILGGSRCAAEDLLGGDVRAADELPGGSICAADELLGGGFGASGDLLGVDVHGIAQYMYAFFRAADGLPNCDLLLGDDVPADGRLLGPTALMLLLNEKTTHTF